MPYRRALHSHNGAPRKIDLSVPGRSWYDTILQACSRAGVRDGLLQEIDGLRFVAILGTILTHLATTIGKYAPPEAGQAFRETTVCGLAEAGVVGVSLFFAISGFILALPFARASLFGEPRTSLKNYYCRRLSRIEPPYIINLLLMTCVLFFTGRRTMDDLIPRLALSSVYLHNVFYDPKDMLNVVGWSLEVEAQFYILAPVLSLVFLIPDKMVRRLVLLWTIIGLSGLIDAWHGRTNGSSLLSHLMFFGVGFLVCDIYLTDWHSRTPGKHWLYDIAGAFALCAMVTVVWLRGLDRLWVSFFIFVLMIAAFRGRLLSAILRRRITYTLGGMCYSTYLYHYLILITLSIVILRWIPVPNNPIMLLLMMAGLVVPIVFATTAIFFVLFEKPFSKRGWPSQWLSKLHTLFRRTRTRADLSIEVQTSLTTH